MKHWILTMAAILLAIALLVLYQRPAKERDPWALLLATTQPRGTKALDYSPLVAQLEEYIAAVDNAQFGIYFQDLHSGQAFGINEEHPFTAASTIKVPLVLYLNHLVAEGKEDFNTRIRYVPERHHQGGNGVLQYDGREEFEYSLRILSNLTITISDNIATAMLLDYLGRPNFVDYMKSLGGKTVYPTGKNVTTARDMGVYLNALLDFAKEHPHLGQRILDDMAHSIFHIGIPQFLPKDIVVAHKEGDLDGVTNDVGIVFTEHPYILAVLCMGGISYDEGFAHIGAISRLVYDYQSQLSRH